MRSEKAGAGRNIIKILPTGTPVEVLDRNGSWATIQLSDDRTGYVLKRYLINRPPYKLTADRLQQQVEKQKAQLTTLTEQLTTLRQEHRRVQKLRTTREAQLTDTTQKYKQLKQDAAQYLRLQEQYTTLQRVHSENQQQLSELRDKFDRVTNDHTKIVFLEGAGVILAGWLIGMITPRLLGRKRRQSGSSYQLPR